MALKKKDAALLTRNFALILLSNIILGAPMPMLIILGGLAGAYLSPLAVAATLPPSVQMLAGVLIAAPLSLLMGRIGRKKGFLIAAAFLILGGLIGTYALVIDSFLLLCFSHFLLGGALVGVNFFRFAAAESVGEAWKAKAISYTLASGLVAALIGPEVFSFSKDFLAPISFAGAYLAVAVLGTIGLVPVLALGKMAAVTAPQQGKGDRAALFRRPRVIFAMSGGAISQGIMVLLMTPTALAMVGCGFSDDQAADVIKWHVIAMFAPGFFTGSLIQKFGATRILASGMVLLAASAAVAIAGLDLTNFYGSLILLGVGWNFGFIGSTALLQAALSAEERPLVQGANDSIIAVSSAIASLFSGALYVGIGWTAIALAVLPILALALVIYLASARRLAAADAPAR
ncbi:MFS transporter [Rhodovibrionaceae bacterium A322]